MKKEIKIKENQIIMPGGVRYIKESNYGLENFQFPHILDKKIPGCGYTEYCLTTDLPIILCSPRKILLENKAMQHINDVFYFKNELDKELGIDKDISVFKLEKSNDINVDENDVNSLNKNNLQEIFSQLTDYLLKCQLNGLFPKILVTYDSFRLVKDYLAGRGLINNFYIVIDEMQSIFIDSRFKSSTELEFIHHLRGLQRVCYVSATPMIDKYLKQVEEFKDLPYFEIDWSSEDPLRIIKPDLKIRTTQSITGTALKIINEYKTGDFKSCVSKDQAGNVINVISNEAVFYVNSVNNILSIIKKAELRPEECNILCARTNYNEKKIKSKLGKDFEIGMVPLLGEQHKMFTFCTRTVYLGADFYSLCARTFILSDANIESLAVDISLDLPQILGRQRLPENPWKNRAEFFYKVLSKTNKLTEEEFNDIIKSKIKKTQDLLNSYLDTRSDAKRTLAEKYIKDIKSSNYKDDYIAVNKHGGNSLVPCLNNLVLIAEQRAFDIQQVDYKDRFSVFNVIIDNNLVEAATFEKISNFLEIFNNNLKDFPSKMKYLCESKLSEGELDIILDQIPLTYKNYYLVLGPKRCHANGYNKTRLDREFLDTTVINIESIIYDNFKEGEKYSNIDAKNKLRDLYSDFGYSKKPKASDLGDFFSIKACKLNIDNKWEHGIEILRKKEGGN